jgi:hypothetical protein
MSIVKRGGFHSQEIAKDESLICIPLLPFHYYPAQTQRLTTFHLVASSASIESSTSFIEFY